LIKKIYLMKCINTKRILFICLLITSSILNAQNVGINATGVAPNISALLDIDAAPSNNKGLLIPRVALVATNSITPITGAIASLLIYNTATAGFGTTAVIPGFYYWDGTLWNRFTTTTNTTNDWNLLGNAGTFPFFNFVGTTDNADLAFRRNNLHAGFIGTVNTSYGLNSLSFLSFSKNNVAFGDSALSLNALGNDNSALGHKALFNNISGINNTATGSSALFANQTGTNNTANGFRALLANTSGADNCAFGKSALAANITGSKNTAVGVDALLINTTTNFNTAIGFSALSNNSLGGNNNTAVGAQASFSNTSGINNTSIGYRSLALNTLGSANTAVGGNALENTNTGNQNTAIGYFALNANTGGVGGNNNTAVGFQSLLLNSTGFNNTGLGHTTNVSLNNLANATAIGFGAIVNANNKVRFGNAAVGIIEGPVIYTVSDGRFKTNVTEEVKGLNFITKLRPVVYNFDAKQFDKFVSKNLPDSILKNRAMIDFTEATAIRQSGFIAQEVEAAAKACNYNFNGVHHPTNETDNYSLSYQTIVVPLVKAVQEQQIQIEELKKMLVVLTKQLEDLKRK
jgi:trimeric autotransporter adhesin